MPDALHVRVESTFENDMPVPQDHQFMQCHMLRCTKLMDKPRKVRGAYAFLFRRAARERLFYRRIQVEGRLLRMKFNFAQLSGFFSTT